MIPLVSVIIPAFNHARYLPATIESVLGQTHSALDVIVVDDGSVDETPRVLEQYVGKVRSLRQDNRGVAAARNAGLRAAHGDYLAFLDADDEWLPTKLERQLARLVSEPGTGLVHCGVVEVDEAGGPLRTRLEGLEGHVSEEMLRLRRAVILGGGSATMVPRWALDEAGGFDESLSTSADWDFYYRISRRCPVAFVAESLVRYRIHSGNMHRNVAAMDADMRRAFAKAYLSEPRPRTPRRRADAALHRMLSGSYFGQGDWGAALRHGIQAVLKAPQELGGFLGFPARWLGRRLGSRA